MRTHEKTKPANVIISNDEVMTWMGVKLSWNLDPLERRFDSCGGIIIRIMETFGNWNPSLCNS